MQFTPQQLSGGPKFTAAVKIGNWAEDRARSELEAKDYELRRAKGKLATASVAESRARNLQAVPHAYSADGKLRYGDTVQLCVPEEDGKGVVQSHYLANNIFEPVDAAARTVAVSATHMDSAVARNTFVIVRAPAKTHYESKTDSDVLCYGDPFQLASNPSLRADPDTKMVARPYLLHSEPASSVMGAGTGASQSVQMAPLPSGNTVWTVVAANGNRLATDGTPVPANADVAIYHKATNVALASLLSASVATSFGPELAVFCQTIKKTGRGAGPAALPGNRWVFVTSSDPSAAVDRRGLRELSPEVLLAQVKQAINSRGAYAFRGLSKAFRTMDDRGDGRLDREDFKFGLRDYGVMLTDEEFEMVMEAFDRDGNGLISLTEFLAALRGEISAARREVIAHAFAKLDKNNSGTVTLEDLRGVYSVEGHPGFTEGKVDPDKALREFLNNWDVTDADGVVTASEFQEYYKDVGAGIDDDDYFVFMVKRAWRLDE